MNEENKDKLTNLKWDITKHHPFDLNSDRVTINASFDINGKSYFVANVFVVPDLQKVIDAVNKEVCSIR